MEILLVLAGLAWGFGGFSVLAVAKGAIHEILAAVLFSFSVLFFGIAGILSRLRSMENARSAATTKAQPARREDDWSAGLTVRG